jgi:hypothetical protein
MAPVLRAASATESRGMFAVFAAIFHHRPRLGCRLDQKQFHVLNQSLHCSSLGKIDRRVAN